MNAARVHQRVPDFESSFMGSRYSIRLSRRCSGARVLDQGHAGNPLPMVLSAERVKGWRYRCSGSSFKEACRSRLSAQSAVVGDVSTERHVQAFAKQRQLDAASHRDSLLVFYRGA